MVDYGIKISAPGVDVKTAAPKDLVVSSAKKCFKVGNVQHDTFTTDANGHFYGVVISHNLGFIPITVIAIEFNGVTYFEPCNISALFFIAEVGSLDITLNFFALSHPNTTFDIYYWLSETEDAL